MSGAPSPDGRYLSFTDWRTGNLALHDLATGEDRSLTNEGYPGFANVSVPSPDGTQVAYNWHVAPGDFDLRIVGVHGAEPRVVYRSEAHRYMEPKAWSPDGEHMLAIFWTRDGNNQIARISVADGSARVLKELDWRALGTMSFSPDGRYIVYDRAAEHYPRRDIFLLSADGSREAALVRDPADDLLLGWAPGGGHVLFASDRAGTLDAWAVPVVDGAVRGPPERVATDIGTHVTALGFGGSGYYYAAMSWVNDLYLAALDPETGKLEAPRRLIGDVGLMTQPDWSPDGRYLAYATGPGDAVYSITLSIRELDSGAVRVLPPLKMRRAGGHALQHRWSADARYLLARGRDHTGRAGFYRIDASNGELTPLAQEQPGESIEWADWTPEGTVMLTRVASGTRRILALDPATGQEREVHRMAGRAGGPALDSPIVVSPDGRQLAFMSPFDDAPVPAAIMVMPAAGGEPRELLRVRRPDTLSQLAWTPNGSHLLFGRGRGRGEEQEFELCRISADGGSPHQLGLAMKGRALYGLSVHPEGRLIAFTAGQPVRHEVRVLEYFLA